MNMYNWITQQINDRNKPAFPLLSYPSVQTMYVTVKELVTSSSSMAMGMRLIADEYKMPAAVSYMDLSVEAEAFGATCVYQADEVPTIIGQLVRTQEDAEALKVPKLGSGRTATAIETIRKATRLIHDRPILANCSGPFSTAGRLMNVNEILVDTYENPETVHTVLRKVTDFIKKYIGGFKRAGADGVILAEPLAGLLSPELMQEFSSDYVKEITDDLQDKNFLIIYHNCANGTERLLPQMLSTGCRVFHVGENADIEAILKGVPADCLVLGNISVSKVFKGNSAHYVQMATQKLLLQCMNYNNFMISSGCDIPADVDMDHVDRFFKTVESGYYKRMLWDMID